MKKIVLLLTLLSIFVVCKVDVYASSYSDSFYISDVIEGISYAKVKDGKTEYRQAKFKRRASDGKIVYCIEPFADLSTSTTYKGYDANYEKLLNLSSSDWERVSLLAYYGYGYSGHTDEKWYPITQILIWETIDKDATFYWTDSYGGSKVTKFTSEIAELESLVENHKTTPSFSNTTSDVSISSTITLTDTNKVLSNYKVSSVSSGASATISGNNLVVKTSDVEGDVTIKLEKSDSTYSTPPIIYVSDTYQNVLSVGSYDTVSASLTLSVNSGSITITKLDSETLTTTPQGEASLAGTVYEVLDSNDEVVGEITISEDGAGSLCSLPYGTYTIKEKTSGTGYILDEEEYTVTIDSSTKDISLELKDDVIKSKIKLYKYLKSDEDTKVESNITFQVIDSSGNIYLEVSTDEYGRIEFDLPYGTYTIKQVNTTDGYSMIDDFTITVDENTDSVLEYYLNDLKIPDTYQSTSNNKISYLFTSVNLLLMGLFVKKYAY